LKTGRSAFDLLVSQSVKVFNSELGVTTFRPNFTLLDPETKQVSMQINHLGLRSPEISPYPQKDEIRLAIIGASTVAGAYAKSNDETFSQRLAKKLRTAGHHANVINGGIEGLGLNELVIVTKQLIVPQRPSKILVYTGFNDISDICKSKGASPQQTWRPPTFQLPHWVMSQEMIRKNTTFLRSQPLRSGNIVDPRSVDFSTWKQQLESIASTIHDANIEPVFITNARAYVNVTSENPADLAASSLFYYSCLDLAGIIKVGEIYNQLIRDLAVKYDATLIDLAAIMPGGRTYFVDGGHFTPKGEEFAAEAIFHAIKDKL
jgi:lysophospholipase L1-like esterase